jgi:phosphatidylinositol alpha-mannosyltransferase
MRVCLVSPYDLARHGGVGKHVLNLAAGLRARGDRVEVIGPYSGSDPLPDGVTGFRGVCSIQGNGSDNRLGLFASPLAVRRFMREHRFDVLHLHEPLLPSLGYWALAFCDAPARIATFHCHCENEGTLSRVARALLAPALARFQRGIAVSQAAARYARVAWTRPLALIGNGVDTRFFAPPPSENAGQGAPTRILFVGQWSDTRKGLPSLTEACVRLRDAGIELQLDVVGQGDGSLLPRGTRFPGVTFHGRLDEASLRARLQASDLLVAPSLGGESFGMVLIEAMAAGRPVICSDIEGYRQVVSPLGALLTPPGDPGALAEAIARLLRDPSLRRAMGRHNRAAALAYDWSGVVDAVRAEYCAALGILPRRRSTPTSKRLETKRAQAGT